tara:strand:+ start:945 stop:1691 length:747 start_codon:yes stop_codon:yes gene_type:complete
MYDRKVKGKKEFIFDNKKEFRSHFPIEPLKSDWRTAPEGSYVLTDDNQVLKILHKNNNYVRTLLGMRKTTGKYTLEGEPVKNIYSFASNVDHFQAVKNRKKPTSREILFARYVIDGNDVVDAYLKAYRTNNRKYAKTHAKLLLKQERIIRMISKENSESLKKIGIDSDYLFEKTKEVIDNLEGKDSDKLRAIELLMKIRDMFPKEEKREALTVFQGFSPEQLDKLKKADEIKPIAHAERKLIEGENND